MNGLWTKCGNSPFWRWSGAPLDSLDQMFIDPVDFVMVLSAAVPGEDAAPVRRLQITEVPREAIESMMAEPTHEDQYFLLWFWGVIESERKREGKRTLMRLFQNASTETRDKVLSSIRKLVAKLTVEQRVAEDEIFAAKNSEAVWNALGEFGILEC